MIAPLMTETLIQLFRQGSLAKHPTQQLPSLPCSFSAFVVLLRPTIIVV
jgi:hypothetical protein